MQNIAQYCQKCRAGNPAGQSHCHKCGTRLMLVTIPSSTRFDESEPTSFYEDYLLERVSILELRLGQLADRVSTALDLILRQSNIIEKEHLLVETLMETVSLLNGQKDEDIRTKWREKIAYQNKQNETEEQLKKDFREILSDHQTPINRENFAKILGEGLTMLSQGEEKQGLKMLEQAVNLSPNNFQLLKYLGVYYWELEKFEKSRKYAEKANELNKKDSIVVLILAVITADCKEKENSENYLKLLAVEPEMRFCISYIRGMLGALSENWTDALTSFKDALICLETPETHYLVGCSFFQLERYKIALRHFVQAVEGDENYSEAWLMMAGTREILGNAVQSDEIIDKLSALKNDKIKNLLLLKSKEQFYKEIPKPFREMNQRKYILSQSDSLRLQKFFQTQVLKVIKKS